VAEAVIVSFARTPIGKAYRGSLNYTHGATLGAHAVAAAVERAGIDGSEVDDVIVGGALLEGTLGLNIARQVALRAGLPATVPGMTVNRFCSTGLQTIALAAQQIRSGQSRIVVAGGLESISLVQNEHMNAYEAEDPWLREHRPQIYMSMLETAEVVATRYGVGRDMQDAYALESQRRTAAAQQAGRFDAEIVGSPKYFPEILVRYTNTLLRHKMLFGSDYPLLTPDRWLRDFAELPIREEVRPLVLRDNAAALLGLSG